jgi:apolipoprotein D and lipocalin family protein
MAASLSDLKAQIETAEQAVRVADARAAESVRLLKAHWSARGPKILVGAASAVIAWQLLRGRRKARAARAMPPPTWARTIGPLLRYGGPKIGTAVTALIAGLVAGKAKKALVTAPYVDLQRYSGAWYEIARLPEKWEKDCASDVTVTYQGTIDGGLRVLHRCRRRDGSLKRTIGRAEVVDFETNAKLRISYAPQLLDPLPFIWSDYCILDVAADYSTAVVGTPDRSQLWLLARSTTVSEETRSAFIAKALGQGFDTSQLIYTRHEQPASATSADAAQPADAAAAAASAPATDYDRVAAEGAPGSASAPQAAPQPSAAPQGARQP